MCCCFDSNLWKYYHIILCIFISSCFIVESASDFNIYCSRIWISLHCKSSEGKKNSEENLFIKNSLLSSGLNTKVFSLLFFVLQAWPEMLKSRTWKCLKSMLIWMENVRVGIAGMVFSVLFRAKVRDFLSGLELLSLIEGQWNQVTRVFHQTIIQSSSVLAKKSLCKVNVKSFHSVHFV